MTDHPTEIDAEIYEIIPAGQAGGAQRLLVRTADRREVAVVAQTPLNTVGREELHRFRGVWKRSGDATIPDEFHLTGPQPDRGRLIALLGDGAEARCFGANAALNERPAVIAGGYGGGGGAIGTPEIGDRLELTPLAQSSCDVIRWGAGLIRDLATANTVMILNPRAYTFKLFRYYPDKPQEAGHLDPVDETYDALARKSPNGWSGFINMLTADAAATGSPNSTHPVEEEQMLRPRGRRIVMPYNPYETWECLHAAMTGLHPGFHPPKPGPRLSPDQRNRLSAAHELAHSIERSAGIYALASPEESEDHRQAQVHACECFADAFAMLAVTHHEQDDAAARIWADLRAAGGWKDDISHMTGPACQATLGEIQALKATGELARLTPQRMVEIATGIAEQHAMTPDQITRMRVARSEVMDADGVEFQRFASKNTLTAYEGVRSAVASGTVKDPLAVDMFKQSLRAIERLSYAPDVLQAAPKLEQALDKAHAEDVAETEAAFEDCIDGLGYMLFRQRLRHEPLAVEQPAAGSMPAHPYGEQAEQAARRRAAPRWARIEQLIADRITPHKDTAEVKADAVPDPVTLIWHSQPDSALAPYYQMTMEQRLQALSDQIDDAPLSQPGRLNLDEQRAFDRINLLAHAIRCDLTGWDAMSTAPENARDTLTRFVTSRAGHKTPVTTSAELHGLRAILPQLQQALKAGKPAVPSP